ncbi:hypothetical protein TrST_g6271 [Triparma strigata]|uniref:Phosphatidylinositol-specific phospholipase C X domain-containing protein n=1 Tax=Triparma strigata TaxID=1606541 RepID=A0A9W7F0W9_9STRA|nr:hypothetical protein TrST_g6271 [Triparma strigata]
MRVAPIMNQDAGLKSNAATPLLDTPSPPVHTFPMQTWMGHHSKLLGDLSLSRMALPGSHNCGSYSVSAKEFGIGPFSPVPTFLGFFFERWSKCHEGNVLKQLEAGVRYLDLRVCISHLDGEIRTEHVVYGEKIKVILEHLRAFLESNPTEIVVLFCHKFRAGMEEMEDHDRFLELVMDTFRGMGDIFVNEGEFGSSYGELIRKGRRLAFLYGDEEVVRIRGQGWLLSPETCQWDRWYDQPTVEGLKNKILENKPFCGVGGATKLAVAQCILSPTPLMTVIGGAISILRFLLFNCFSFGGVNQNLMMLAARSNDLASKFVRGDFGDFKFNVILLDDTTGCENENLLRSIVCGNVK